MIFTSPFPPLFAQASQAHADEMHGTQELSRRAHGFPAAEMIPAGIIWQGDPEEQLASLWAFKRKGIKPSTLIKLWEITQRLGENPGTVSSQLNGSATKIYKIRPILSLSRPQISERNQKRQKAALKALNETF